MYSELSWSVFSRIRTEYGEIQSISLYSVRMRENMDQKKLHKVTIKKHKLFRTNSLVLAHSSAKTFYIEQLTVKSSIQWYHMTLI